MECHNSPPPIVIDFNKIISTLSFDFLMNLKANYTCTVSADPATFSFFFDSNFWFGLFKNKPVNMR